MTQIKLKLNVKKRWQQLVIFLKKDVKLAKIKKIIQYWDKIKYLNFSLKYEENKA